MDATNVSPRCVTPQQIITLSLLDGGNTLNTKENRPHKFSIGTTVMKCHQNITKIGHVGIMTS